MIEYLRIEIKPNPSFGREIREFRMEVKTSNGPTVVTNRICEPDELISFFDLIFDKAKDEILRHLKGKDTRKVGE